MYLSIHNTYIHTVSEVHRAVEQEKHKIATETLITLINKIL